MAIYKIPAQKLHREFKKKLKNATTVLDIGCGIQPQEFLECNIHICCEPYEEYVQKLLDKSKSIPDKEFIVIKAVWGKVVDLIPPKSVDTIFIVDVIEHLDKGEAKKLLDKTVKIARKQVAIFTPLGFMPQHHEDGKDAWGLNGASWQEHKSGWYPEDFGSGWDFFVSEVYHTHDNLGKKLDTTYGAFWALHTVEYKSEKQNLLVYKINKLFNKICSNLKLMLYKLKMVVYGKKN